MKPFGWMITSAPSSSAFFQNGAKAGSDNSFPATLVRISTPLNFERLHAVLEFFCGLVAVLHRHGAARDETVLVARNEFGNAIVDHARGRHRIFECDRVIALRWRRHHQLHVDAHLVHDGKAFVIAGHAATDVGFLLGVDRLGFGRSEMRERNGADIEMWLDEFGGARDGNVRMSIDRHALRSYVAPWLAMLARSGVGVFVPRCQPFPASRLSSSARAEDPVTWAFAIFNAENLRTPQGAGADRRRLFPVLPGSRRPQRGRC